MNESQIEAVAIMAVNSILLNLADRKGLGDEWDQIDPDIQLEIRQEWERRVRVAIAARLPNAPSTSQDGK